VRVGFGEKEGRSAVTTRAFSTTSSACTTSPSRETGSGVGMSIATVNALVDVLRAHRLLQPDQISELDPEFLLRFANVRALAKYLLARGWLTVYQVNQLFRGNARDLVLGPYRLLDVLGEGGISLVFKAWDTRRKCVATLKSIKAEYLDNA